MMNSIQTFIERLSGAAVTESFQHEVRGLNRNESLEDLMVAAMTPARKTRRESIDLGVGLPPLAHN